jgi:hypothetical protein
MNLTPLLGDTTTARHSKLVTYHVRAVKIFVWLLYFKNIVTLCTISDTASSLDGLQLLYWCLVQNSFELMVCDNIKGA